MIRGYGPQNGGLVLFTPPSRQQRAARRRWVAFALVASLAAAGGLIGQFSAHRNALAPSLPPGPLSYLPQ